MAAAVVRLRNAKGYTQDGLAAASGISRATIQKLEKGDPPKRSNNLRAIAEALEVTIEQLRGEEQARRADDEAVQMAREALHMRLDRDPTDDEVTRWLLQAALEKIRRETSKDDPNEP